MFPKRYLAFEIVREKALKLISLPKISKNAATVTKAIY
jgi:hypothetical protein